MDIKTRKASPDDLERMLEIEESAIPGYGYLYENRHFYFDGKENDGEMILAVAVLADGREFPVGMGQYSVLPDGSGWLEILRVHKDFQNQGAGKAIYSRYLELAKQTAAPSAAMFTGWKNAASRGLAEKNGFSLAASYAGYDRMILPGDEKTESKPPFLPVPDEAEAARLLARAVENEKENGGWGKFLVLNRTFFHYGEPLYRYLAQKQMIYTDGSNVIVLGCRMLRHRGLHLGFFSGDAKACLDFAVAETARLGLPKLTVMFPPERKDLEKQVLVEGFSSSGELIVMERKFFEKRN